MEISKVSLDIANYWRDNQYLKESNKNAGVIVAFDWLNDKLIEINTNIDLGDFEVKYFQFETFKNFIQKNNFNFDPCDLDNCQFASRHYRCTDDAKYDRDNIDPDLSVHYDCLDSFHYFLFHLFHAGFRSINHENDDIDDSIISKRTCFSLR